jgi:hypothetical protein
MSSVICHLLRASPASPASSSGSTEVKLASKLDECLADYNYWKYQGDGAGTGEIQQSNK